MVYFATWNGVLIIDVVAIVLIFMINLILEQKQYVPNSLVQSSEEIVNFFKEYSELTSYNILEREVSSKYSYDPIIFNFSFESSPIIILAKLAEMGGNVLVRKIEFINGNLSSEMHSLTLYISLIKSGIK